MLLCDSVNGLDLGTWVFPLTLDLELLIRCLHWLVQCAIQIDLCPSTESVLCQIKNSPSIFDQFPLVVNTLGT